MASTPQGGPPLERQDPFAEGILPIAAELLTPRHFPWVSCNKLYDRSLEYASINNNKELRESLGDEAKRTVRVMALTPQGWAKRVYSVATRKFGDSLSRK
jgi:hypothetical protein